MESKLADDFHEGSVVSIKGLQLTNGAKAPNIWGDIKDQPALVHISLHLRDFDSAASADALDDSTVHYGELAKRIRSKCQEQSHQMLLLEGISLAAEGMATKTSRFIASKIVAELDLPKASAYGTGLSLLDTRTYDSDGKVQSRRRTFKCSGLKIMTLVGVNAYERRGKQALIVDINIRLGQQGSSQPSQQAMESLFPLERDFVRIVEETDFETLESLANFAVRELQSALRARDVDAEFVHLRFEKPAAIAFADAPVIEVRRRLQ